MGRNPIKLRQSPDMTIAVDWDAESQALIIRRLTRLRMQESQTVFQHVYTFCNLLGLLESAIMLRTSTREINV